MRTIAGGGSYGGGADGGGQGGANNGALYANDLVLRGGDGAITIVLRQP